MLIKTDSPATFDYTTFSLLSESISFHNIFSRFFITPLIHPSDITFMFLLLFRLISLPTPLPSILLIFSTNPLPRQSLSFPGLPLPSGVFPSILHI